MVLRPLSHFDADSMSATTTLRIPFALALVAAAALPAQTVATIPCAADNTLYETLTGDASNGAGTSMFVGLTATGSIRRGVLRFDVGAALPANAKVLSAQLRLTVAQSTVALPIAMTGHRLLQSWGEGTSVASGGGGGGGIATTGDATWLHRFWNTTLWTTPGGDFVATPSFTGQMPGLGQFTTDASRQAAADVEWWLANPTSNFGWLLRTNEQLASTAHRINTREAASGRPELVVSYLLPGQVGSWGTGCLVGAQPFTASWIGTPSGGNTVTNGKFQGPPASVGADFFALAIDPAGLPLLPGCGAFLPLAELLPGSAFLTDAAGNAQTSLLIPNGFPGYLIASQSAVLTNNPLGFVVSNAALLVTQ
jgi:hypothetical protein